MTNPSDRTEIWILLANIFFSGDRPTEERLIVAARRLNAVGWDRTTTERALLELITPHAKRNLGYGLPTAIGEEDLLEEENLLPKILRSEAIRRKPRSSWYFFFQDWYHKRLLKQLEVDRLLRKLELKS